MLNNGLARRLVGTARWLGPLAVALLIAACNPAASGGGGGPAASTPTIPATATAVPPAPTSAVANPATALPAGAVPLHEMVRADLDGDGTEEVVVLAAFGASADRLSAEAVELFVLAQEADGFGVAWRSGELLGERAEALRVADVNGDDRPEVLSVQSMGAAGETLYVLAWQGSEYGFLSPKGGYFDGQDSFGEHGGRLEDQDGDGTMEIVATHGRAASAEQVYRWNGSAYVADAAGTPVTGQPGETEENLVVEAITDKSEYDRGETVQFSIALQNKNDAVQRAWRLQFSSGQRFDISVVDERGDEVWRWSRGRFFTMALATVDLGPGESLSFEADWDQQGNDGPPIPAGRYTAKIWITADKQPSTSASFIIR